MSNNTIPTFCFIDNTTNKCSDKNYNTVYDNNGNDVYKVNYYNTPSPMNFQSGATNIGSSSLNSSMLNNNTQPYAHIGHDVGNNTTFTNKLI